MKASEIITILQKEIDTRGDLEVVLYGAYGAESETFEVADATNVDKQKLATQIWIWTGINTG